MKYFTTNQMLNTGSRLAVRVLGALTAITLLGAVAPTELRAGDDSAAATTHTQRHVAARLRHSRRLHYVSEPRINAEGRTPAPVKTENDATTEKPLPESFFRSYQENNMVNPG